MFASPPSENFPSPTGDGSSSGALATPPPVGQPAGGFHSRESRYRAIAVTRYETLREFQRLRLHGRSHAAACQQLRVSHPTMWRHARALNTGGFEALLPRYGCSGRRRSVDFNCITSDLVRQVQALTLLHGSATRGWFAFARTPQCPQPLATWLQGRRYVPVELLRLSRLTEHRVRAWTGQQFLAFEFPTPKPHESLHSL